MPPTVTIHDKATGELVDELKVEARPHVTNYQAMIAWKGIVKIAYGDSMDAAIRCLVLRRTAPRPGTAVHGILHFCTGDRARGRYRWARPSSSCRGSST